MNHVDLLADVTDEWAIVDSSKCTAKRLDDKRYVAVLTLLYTHRVVGGWIGDEDGYEDCWCYHDAIAALVAASAWDGTGEPTGWHRHPPSGRRRPDGDPTREEVRL